jgi:anti-sigma B factor antagonist
VTQLVVSSQPDGDQPLLRAVGEIDLASGPVLAEALEQAFAAGASSLRLDLSGVTYMDSSGLGVLALATDRAAASGGTLCVEGASPLVCRLFQISGLDAVIELA